MEHLLNEVELELASERIDPMPWLGFNHDTEQKYPIAATHLASYAYDRGYTLEQISRIAMEKEYTREQLALFQSWLFFGIWEVVLNRPLATCDFVQETPRGPRLNTAPLRPMLEQFQVNARKETLDLTSEVQLSRVNTSLHVLNFWQEFLFQSWSDQLPEHDDVNRLITLTGETLQSAALWLPNEYASRVERKSFSRTEKDWARMRQKFTSRGWCPSALAYFKETFGQLACEHGAVFGPVITDPLGAHNDCGGTKCIAQNIDNLSQYRARHTTISCDCARISAYNDTASSLVNQHGFFLIDIDSMNTPGTSPDQWVVDPQRGHPYYAVSHVWGDGRGSQAERGLPACQVAEIKRIVTESRERFGVHSSLVWIDSLCIPELPEQRTLGIAAIRNVFEGAAATIVLDDRMEQFKIGEFESMERMIINLSFTAWNRRLWTFEEAVLSQALIFVCGRHVILHFAIIVDLLGDPTISPLLSRLIGTLGLMSGPRARSSYRKFNALSKALRYKSTSRAEDEYTCLSNIMGLDTSLLAKKYDEDRIEEFWRQTGQAFNLPTDIAFYGAHKLTKRGFRWAPRSLLSSDEGDSIRDVEPLATVTSEGLRGYFKLLVLDSELLIPAGNASTITYVLAVTKKVGNDTTAVLESPPQNEENQREAPASFLSIWDKPRQFYLIPTGEIESELACDAIALRGDPPALSGVHIPALLLRSNGSVYEVKASAAVNKPVTPHGEAIGIHKHGALLELPVVDCIFAEREITLS